MHTKLSHHTTRHALPGAPFYILLFILVVHLPLPVLGQANYATPYTFTTLAGNAGYGSTDGTGNTARFWYLRGVAVDSAGNVYVADTYNCTIRKVTSSGVVATLAGLAGSSGSTDATGNAARFTGPSGVAVDSAGIIYVADQNNSTIRKVTPGGSVTTLAGLAGSAGSMDGTGSAAQFSFPAGVAVDSKGNVYVADTDNSTIRKVTPAGVVTTLAGLAGSTGTNDGMGNAAQFNHPSGVAVDSLGNIYVADSDNDTIRKVTAAGVVTTLAGVAGIAGSNDGTGSAAQFSFPSGIAVDSSNNLYVADMDNASIRKVTPGGVVTTLAGSSAHFYYPFGVAVDSANNVYVADTDDSVICKVTPAGVVTTLAGLARSPVCGDGLGITARFSIPNGAAVDSEGNIYVADTGNHIIRKMTSAGAVMTLAGLADISGTNDGTGNAARFNEPSGVAVDSAGNLYVADTSNNTIRKVTPAGVVTTLAGMADSLGTNDGTGSAARFYQPYGVAVDSQGNVYVGDDGNNAIRKITPAGVVTTLAGLAGYAYTGSTDGTGSAARFHNPGGVAVDSAGNVYVADHGNDTIRKVTTAGVVTTLAGMAGSAGNSDGTGSAARFSYPQGVTLDSTGNLYVADTGNCMIRKVTPAGVVTTLAGLAETSGSVDGTGSAARFYDPSGAAVDSMGNIYVADTENGAIRKGVPASSVVMPVLHSPSLSAGQFGFAITGTSGLAVDIQSKGTLSQWQVIGTYVLVGGTNYSVNIVPSQGLQFYRGHVR